MLHPARRYAAEGFAASPIHAWATGAVLELPGADDYRKAGPVRAGTVIRRPGVGRALAAVVADGRDGFYGGEFGAGLLALGGGEYVPDDLATTSAEWVEPLGIDAWGHRVWTAPPNSQGYLTLAAAGILQGLDLPTDPADPEWAHLLVEAARQAGHDRMRVLFSIAGDFTSSNIHRVVLLPPFTSEGFAAGQSVVFPDWGQILPLVHQSFP